MSKIKKWTGLRVKVNSAEFIGPNELGTALGEPIMLGQLWLPVIWDHEEDPEFFKLAGILEA